MEKKQVGIITFHSSDNYGAVLQAYALQHYIESSLKFDVEIIDYREADENKGPFVFVRATHNWMKDLVLSIVRFLNYSSLKKRHEKFEKFRKNFLHLTHLRYIGTESLKHLSKDFYISGSDQVFNPTLKNYKAYYLGFDKGNGKKIAYAPSFGISSFNDGITRQILPLLADFDVLSCREEIGAKYISNILGNDIPVVLDPVFLLSKEEWKGVSVVPETKKKYLLVYSLTKGKSGKINQLARSIAKKKKLTVVTIGNSGLFTHKGVNDVGPREFVGYFLNAEFVVTDSFHGTSFSLIFGKRVLSIIANKNTGSRIENIMNIFGRSDDVIRDVDKYKSNEKEKYYLEDRHLELLEASKRFLNTNLS